MKSKLTLIFCLVSVLVCSCAKESSVEFLGESLVALSSKGDTQFYKFTQSQMQQIKTFALSQEGASFVVRLRKNAEVPKEAVTFYTGFLYDEDFLPDGKLLETLEPRYEVSGVLSAEQLSCVDVAVVVPKEKVPAGFFIKAEEGLILDSVYKTDAVLGFDRTLSVPLYAFGLEGGGINPSSCNFDFSSGDKIFPAKNTDASVLPKIVVKKESTPDIGTLSEQLTIRATYAGEDFALRASPVCDQFTFECSAFKNPYGFFEFSTHEELILSCLMSASDPSLIPLQGEVIYPFVSDMGLLFDWPRENWRTADYELFRWEAFPDVLVFDTANYEVQNLFFTRLAYFVEKAGYKGTFVSDSFIRTEHGYNAHDYKADDLARFFTQAERQNVNLNRYEILLKKILIANGIILEDGQKTYKAGKGSVISFSKESESYLRYQLIAHEGWHGIYFGDEAFRDTVAMAYLMFDPVYLDFLQTYWSTYASLQYDRNDDYLMKNEFMAYHLERPVSQIADYFITRAGWASVQRTQKKNADYVIASGAEGFTDTAMFLSEYVFTRWGLAAGRVWNISR